MNGYTYALAWVSLGVVVLMLADTIWQQLRKP